MILTQGRIAQANELRNNAEAIFKVIRAADGGVHDQDSEKDQVTLLQAENKVQLEPLLVIDATFPRLLVQGTAVFGEGRAPQATAMVSDLAWTKYSLTTKAEKTGLFGLFGPEQQVSEYRSSWDCGGSLSTETIATFDQSGKVLHMETFRQPI